MVFNFAHCCAAKRKQIISLFYLSFPHEFSLEVLSLFLGQQWLAAVREELHEKA
jgi:hypothetical protein